MKTPPLVLSLLCLSLTVAANAHSWKAADTDREAMRAHLLADWQEAHAKATEGEIKALRSASANPALTLTLAAAASANAAGAPAQSKAFQLFPKLDLKWDNDFLLVGSHGLPDHNMMVGITAWQQQVPLPQNYIGDNAWRIPLHPVPSKNPVSIKGRFLRGAVALAVNGIPIFNPQNNRGEVSQEIGELDQWGGHCGRADDYHYHAAPFHLQSVVGKGLPIAFALDGYPIYGLEEPNGATPVGLDEFHGHETPALGYHYHGSKSYPYVNGGFHGEVTEADGQVDPQPRAQPVRQDQPPLRGAKIIDFKLSPDGRTRFLSYSVGSSKGAVNFTQLQDGSWKFQFVSTEGSKTEQTYSADDRRGGGGNKPPRGGADRPKGGKGKRPEPEERPAPPTAASGSFILTSPVVKDGGDLPVEYTGDGKGESPPLAWSGAPAGTQSYAIVMDHLDPEGKTKWYWTLWDIPASTHGLPANAKGIGKMGTGFKGVVGYEPPHSRGPGAKTYVIHAYALSSALAISAPPSSVDREMLVAAMQGKILASSDLHVVHTRNGDTEGKEAGPREPRSPQPEGKGPPKNDRPPPPPPPQEAQGPGGGQRKPWIQMHGSELDANKDGVITLAEMTADLERAMAIYDTNKDGVITPQEIDATGDVRDGAAFAGFIYRHAIDLDANGDSKLTKDELTAAAKFIFDTADQNHDGSITTAEVQSSPNAPLPIPPNADAAPRDKAPPSQEPPTGAAPKKGKGKGGPDKSGLIKPTMADTIKVNVYADNWFVLFINGKLTAVDSIEFTPHNVVSVDILPEYPMTIAIMAKDNADTKTGMEYGDHIGDGGFIIKFADGTVSNATWKAKSFFKGPLNHDTKNPVVVHTPIPDKWWTVDFDDSTWPHATEYSEERVNPKEPFYQADFAGTKFIWTDDLDLDNTVIFRTKVVKEGWKARWNTHSDMDMSGAPFK